jgi:hypothetical protein
VVRHGAEITRALRKSLLRRLQGSEIKATAASLAVLGGPPLASYIAVSLSVTWSERCRNPSAGKPYDGFEGPSLRCGHTVRLCSLCSIWSKVGELAQNPRGVRSAGRAGSPRKAGWQSASRLRYYCYKFWPTEQVTWTAWRR